MFHTHSRRSISGPDIGLMAVLSILYLGLSYFLIGFKSDQLVLLSIINVCYFISPQTRKLLLSFAPFIIFWIIFDYMKAFPNYQYNQVHIGSLYQSEKALFGFIHDGSPLTPNEYFEANSTPWLDALSGLFYLTWVPVPIGLCMYFFFKKKREAVHLPLTFLLVNLIGFMVYYLYPAAPPWYVQDHGFDFIRDTPGSAAGLLRFDRVMGIELFSNMYEKSSNVFAAMPSLHSAYPLVALYYALKSGHKKAALFIGLTAVGIWFSAIYSNHHYVLDVLAGMACAVAGIAGYELMYRNNSLFRKGVDRYINLTIK